jgi:hypothetical protein
MDQNPIPLLARGVPIHTAPDPKQAAEYGFWAAGSGYKVSFHDGFVFYPCRGSARELVAVRWTTEAITAGGEPLLDAARAPAHWHADWRYEYCHPGITEAYDVRPEGVEQTFVIHRQPARGGELVVIGRLDSELRASASPTATHGPIALCDETGREVVRYGAAFAVDALGRRLPLTTSCDGARVCLTVPGAWLAAAAFPVTIDPLTSSVAIAHGDTTHLAISRENESTTKNVMVFYTMQYAYNDWDTFAFLCDSDFQNPWLVYAAISTAWNTLAADVAFAGGSDRWIMAYRRRDAGNTLPSELYINAHLKGNLQLNSGLTVLVPNSGTQSNHAVAAVGGSEGGTQVLIAFIGASSNGANAVWGVLLDASTLVAQPPQRIDPPTVNVGGHVDVSDRNTAADPSWLVVYDSSIGTFPNISYTVHAQRIDSQNLGHRSAALIAGYPGTSVSHPYVDGRDGRYLIAMTRHPIYHGTVRVDWPNTAVTPTIGTMNAILPSAILYPTSVAYDHLTLSHWCVAYQTPAAGSGACRVGFTGAPTETVTLDAGVDPQVEWCPPQTAFNPVAREFLLAHASHVTTPPRLQGLRLQYPPDATTIAYGTPCGRSVTLSPNQPPYAGSQYFGVTVRGMPASAPYVMLVGADSADLPFLGCTLNIASITLSVPRTATSTGAGLIYLALRDAPLLLGDVFLQWAWIDNQSLGMSRGLKVQIR